MVKRAAGIFAVFCMTGGGFAQNLAVEQVRTRTQGISRADSVELKMIAEERGEVVELTGRPARALQLRAGISTNLEYQSNSPALPSGPRGDWLSLSAFEAGLNKPLGEQFSLDLSIRTDVAAYFHFDGISYWGPSAIGLVYYRPSANWPRVYVGGQLYRYDNIRNGSKITDAGAVIAGTDHSLVFDGGRSVLSIGYQFARYWANPLTEERTSHVLFASFTRQLSGSLYAQASWNWQYSDFDALARRDSRNLIGLGLIYAVKENVALRIYANYLRNESNNPFVDYENFTVGLGVNVMLRF
ncbi:MAG: outer membrane beta-barrel protein [Chthoniobacteraceae bacterium]